jgi:hypothetical protein
MPIATGRRRTKRRKIIHKLVLRRSPLFCRSLASRIGGVERARPGAAGREERRVVVAVERRSSPSKTKNPSLVRLKNTSPPSNPIPHPEAELFPIEAQPGGKAERTPLFYSVESMIDFSFLLCSPPLSPSSKRIGSRSPPPASTISCQQRLLPGSKAW